jgi:starch-binding outer membrane protein, SusD/RagB family
MNRMTHDHSGKNSDDVTSISSFKNIKYFQMKQIIYNIPISMVILLMLAFMSCSKYLDKKPDSSVTVPTTLADLQAILDFTNNMNLQTTPGFGESSADDYFLLEPDYDFYTVEAQKIYTWNRGDYYFQNSWSRAYTPIFNANFCLDQLKNIPITNGNMLQWNNVKGSGLFYCSYYFLDLLWDFAKAYDSASYNTDLGIVLRLTSDFNVPSKRSTVKECYDRVIEDTKEAVNYLPDYAINLLRPSKAAAYGLLARSYLSMRIYDSAFRYASLCLQLNHNLIDYNNDNDINGSIESDIPFKKFNKETIFYTEMDQDDLLNNFWRATIDTTLYASYDSTDLRKTAYFTPFDNYFKFKCIYTGDNAYYFTGIATDEIYLIKAECEARMGSLQAAMDDLNTLMIKRWKSGTFVPFTVSERTEALNIILKERRKELIDRGLRWIDLKRYNLEGANIVLTRKMKGETYTLQPNANYYALPLPADIIKATGIPQNKH